MIEKLSCLGVRLGFTAQANAFFNRAINYLCFRHGFEDLIQNSIGCLFVDLFQPEIALQSLSADRSLLHAQRRKAVRELCVIEIAVLAQTFDHCFDGRFGRASTFEQTFS